MRILAAMLTVAGAAAAAVQLPVAFEPNRGQFPVSADFVATGPGYRFALRAGETEFVTTRSHVTMRLGGARGSVAPREESPLPGVVNYLRGNDPARWITSLPTYARVRYR